MHANSRKAPNDPFVLKCPLKSAKGVLKFANVCVKKPVKRYSVRSVRQGQVTPAVGLVGGRVLQLCLFYPSRRKIKRRLKPRKAQNLLGDKRNLLGSKYEADCSATAASRAETREKRPERKVSQTKATLLTADGVCSSSQRSEKDAGAAVAWQTLVCGRVSAQHGGRVDSNLSGLEESTQRGREPGRGVAEKSHAGFTPVKILSYNQTWDV